MCRPAFLFRISGPIVVPHDGIEMSDEALSRAIEFAGAFKSDLVVVHIVDSRFAPPNTNLGLVSEKKKTQRRS